MRYTVLMVIMFAIVYSCNPVKRVLNDPVKTNEVAQELIRRGYCANDTTIITQVTDTVYVKSENVEDTLFFEPGICNFDTVLKSGTRLRYENGLLFISEKVKYKTRVITNTVDNYIRDTKYESLLKTDIQFYKDTVNLLHGKITTYKGHVAAMERKINHRSWLIGLLLALIVGSFALRIYNNLKPLR